jgi:hypothetical protein
MPDTPYFTVSEFRTRYDDLATGPMIAKYPDAEIEQVRALAEATIEAPYPACDVACVPRTATETVDAYGGYLLELAHRHVREVTALSIAGTPVTEGLAVIVPAGPSSFYRAGGWGLGYSTVQITYSHGHDQPPLPIKEAALILTRVLLVEGPVTKRATQQINAETGGVVNLATPGMFGAITGIPAVDATIRQHREIGGLA